MRLGGVHVAGTVSLGDGTLVEMVHLGVWWGAASEGPPEKSSTGRRGQSLHWALGHLRGQRAGVWPGGVAWARCHDHHILLQLFVKSRSQVCSRWGPLSLMFRESRHDPCP